MSKFIPTASCSFSFHSPPLPWTAGERSHLPWSSCQAVTDVPLLQIRLLRWDWCSSPNTRKSKALREAFPQNRFSWEVSSTPSLILHPAWLEPSGTSAWSSATDQCCRKHLHSSCVRWLNSKKAGWLKCAQTYISNTLKKDNGISFPQVKRARTVFRTTLFPSSLSAWANTANIHTLLKFMNSHPTSLPL